ncbi:MAG: AIM24 family protein, partial [Adhaeribacter sp.]
MRSHEIDYKILGNDIQVLEVELDQNETVIAEAGAMVYMEDGVHFETKMGDGSEPSQGFLGKLVSVGSRLLTGESLFMTHFTHRGRNPKTRIGFSAPYPGTILPVDLSR